MQADLKMVGLGDDLYEDRKEWKVVCSHGLIKKYLIRWGLKLVQQMRTIKLAGFPLAPVVYHSGSKETD